MYETVTVIMQDGIQHGALPSIRDLVATQSFASSYGIHFRYPSIMMH